MPDRKTPPPFHPTRTLTLLPVDRVNLKNGIVLHTLKGGDQEIIRLELTFEAGRWAEELVGQSQFTAGSLNKGTGTMTSYEIASIFDQYGAYLEIAPGFDFVTIATYTLRKWIGELLDVFIDILSRPTFPEKEVSQLKEISLENLKVNQEKVQYLASKHFRKLVFGPAHPYGTEVDEQDIRKIRAGLLSDFHGKFFLRPSAWLVGNIDDRVTRLVQTKLESFDGVALAGKEAIFEVPRPSVFHLERAGAVQSSIRMGRVMPTRESAEYPQIQFVNHLLGGYFGSRLMTSLREEQGLTYGIHSSIHTFRNAAFLSISTEVNKDKLEIALQAIRAELEKLITEPVPREELETARNHFVGSFLTEINTAFAHADKQKNIVLYGLTSDYYRQLLERVGRMSGEEVMQTARTYFDPEVFSTVTVG